MLLIPNVQTDGLEDRAAPHELLARNSLGECIIHLDMGQVRYITRRRRVKTYYFRVPSGCCAGPTPFRGQMTKYGQSRRGAKGTSDDQGRGIRESSCPMPSALRTMSSAC